MWPQCLLLSERLQHIGRAFDHCRAVRYQQVMRQRNKRSASQARHCLAALSLCARQLVHTSSLRSALQPNRQPAIASDGERLSSCPQALGAREDGRFATDGRSASAAWAGQQQAQVQQTSDAENAALQQQLLSMSADVTHMERSMREIATLNQMFSTQVVHQSEQIEHIYSQVRTGTSGVTGPCMADKVCAVAVAGRTLSSNYTVFLKHSCLNLAGCANVCEHLAGKHPPAAGHRIQRRRAPLRAVPAARGFRNAPLPRLVLQRYASMMSPG